MKFYNRQKELAALAKQHQQSLQTACFSVVIGRRRIGKTALLLKSIEQQRYLYLFVSRRNEQLLCAQYQQEAQQALGLTIYGQITTFRALFEELLNYAIQSHYTLIIDEFQEFTHVNPAIFSDIQDLWDRYKDQAKIHFIACGSIYSLMVDIFENSKEPLFGRSTAKFVLKPFGVSTIKEILADHNPTYTAEDLLCLYLLTGGVAKYLVLLMDAGAYSHSAMLDWVCQPESPLLGEGKDLLVSEFGRDYTTYFSILQLIAASKTSQAEIDSIIEKNTGAYLANLEREYSLITKQKPIFAKPTSRKAKWQIDDNYLRFWFRFVFPNQGVIELGNLGLLRTYIDRHYTQYSGLLLEKYFREKLGESGTITDIGAYWDSKGQNEIDLIAINRLDKTALLAEIKRNPNKIDLDRLKLKAASLSKELAPYQVSYRGYSLDDL